MSVSEIASEFLRVYQKCLAQDISQIYKFYDANALVSYRLVEQGQQKELPTAQEVKGVEEIQKRIEEFKAWERVEQGKNFICQKGIENSIVIMVRGNARTSQGRRAKYSQTFVLTTSEQDKEHYYVRNDLLHIEEINSKASKRNSAAKKAQEKKETTPEESKSSGETKPNGKQTPPKQKPKKQAKKESKDVKEVKEAKAPEQPKQKKEKKEKKQVAKKKQEEKKKQEPKKKEKKEVAKKEVAKPKKQDQPKKSKNQKPQTITYASIAGKEPAPQPNGKPEKKAKKKPQPPSPSAQSPKQVYAIHVNKIPDTSVSELQKIFGKFGKIEDINYKSLPSGLNFAFVFFKTESAFKKALKAKVSIQGKDVIIQERRSKKWSKSK